METRKISNRPSFWYYSDRDSDKPGKFPIKPEICVIYIWKPLPAMENRGCYAATGKQLNEMEGMASLW